MEKPNLGTIEEQINKAGKRVFQMKREGRDQEYMINQLDFEGYDHQVIRRLLYAVEEEKAKEEKVVQHVEGSRLSVTGIIILIVGCSLSIISFLFGIGDVYYVFGVGAILSGIFLIVRGFIKKSK